MNTLSHKSPTFAADLLTLDRRHIPTPELMAYVGNIIDTVRSGGDKAVADFANQFDHASLSPDSLAVPPDVVAAAAKSVPSNVKKALKASCRNVVAFAKRSLRKGWHMKNEQGAVIGESYQPFQRVGIYVPGGTAPLISTVIMTVTLAKAAGVPEIVVCSPCGPDGRINDAMLYALQLAGATEIYRIGGAHAIAALTFGTESIRPVDKIMGPGNKFVVEAKRQLFGAVAIDLLPGPSEIMVLADDSARPDFIAADLLAQAEHGRDSKVLLATPSLKLLRAVEKEVARLLDLLPRADIARASLESGGYLVHIKDLNQGVAIANAWAPEHLSLVVRNDRKLIPLIRTSGAIFVGNYSPVAAGDFLAGPSHTLPTGGAGKSFPGLTVDQFQRRTSIVRLNRSALRKSEPFISTFSEIEGLAAHGLSASIRANS
jgi:histidinol dehydrogenase